VLVCEKRVQTAGERVVAGGELAEFLPRWAGSRASYA
jgi:hypothetical protein